MVKQRRKNLKEKQVGCFDLGFWLYLMNVVNCETHLLISGSAVLLCSAEDSNHVLLKAREASSYQNPRDFCVRDVAKGWDHPFNASYFICLFAKKRCIGMMLERCHSCCESETGSFSILPRPCCEYQATKLHINMSIYQ